MPQCLIKAQCTPSSYRRIRRWEHEDVLERVQQRLDRKLDAMTVRRRTVEHMFGTLKHWMGTPHFLTKTLAHVGTEMSLQVLAYNLKRVMRILGIAGAMKAMRLGGVSPSHAALPISKTQRAPHTVTLKNRPKGWPGRLIRPSTAPEFDPLLCRTCFHTASATSGHRASSRVDRAASGRRHWTYGS